MNEVCTFCNKPVIPFVEATYGTSGNHYDCHEKAQADLARQQDAIDLIQHVTQWYQMLGSSEVEARRRVAQERKLIIVRNTK